MRARQRQQIVPVKQVRWSVVACSLCTFGTFMVSRSLYTNSQCIFQNGHHELRFRWAHLLRMLKLSLLVRWSARTDYSETNDEPTQQAGAALPYAPGHRFRQCLDTSMTRDSMHGVIENSLAGLQSCKIAPRSFRSRTTPPHRAATTAVSSSSWRAPITCRSPGLLLLSQSSEQDYWPRAREFCDWEPARTRTNLGSSSMGSNNLGANRPC